MTTELPLIVACAAENFPSSPAISQCVKGLLLLDLRPLLCEKRTIAVPFLIKDGNFADLNRGPEYLISSRGGY